MKDKILTIRELADYLKLTEKTTYKLVAEGKIPGFKVGGSWRFKKEVIEAWISKSSIIDEDDDDDTNKKKLKPRL